MACWLEIVSYNVSDLMAQFSYPAPAVVWSSHLTIKSAAVISNASTADYRKASVDAHRLYRGQSKNHGKE